MAKVLNAGLQTIIEQWKGRPGYMELGISHSGTMDHYAARFSNLLVGNDLNAPMIEVTAGNFALSFEEETVVAVTGADYGGKFADAPLRMWQSFAVKPGQVLQIGAMLSSVVGFRQYIAVAGGVDVPEYLGSKSTAIYGSFGGYQGRALKRGDILKFGNAGKAAAGLKVADRYMPKYSNAWEMHAIPGPDSAPDFFTEEGMDLFFSATWKTQTLADRSGIRLTGPKPIFNPERAAAGGHPSNITDHGYPGPGCVNISGDTPILFPREAPTSGGYVCALSIVYADQWMMGQIIPGVDSVKFVLSTQAEADQLRRAQMAIFDDPNAIVKA